METTALRYPSTERFIPLYGLPHAQLQTVVARCDDLVSWQKFPFGGICSRCCKRCLSGGSLAIHHSAEVPIWDPEVRKTMVIACPACLHEVVDQCEKYQEQLRSEALKLLHDVYGSPSDNEDDDCGIPGFLSSQEDDDEGEYPPPPDWERLFDEVVTDLIRDAE